MNFISMADLDGNLEKILELSTKLKKDGFSSILKQKTLAMIFEKVSTRTRVSFEVAMTQLGGHAIYMEPESMQLKRGETIRDTAKALGGYTDCIMVRAYLHDNVVELGKYAEVPVINGLTDLEHPCQAISDLFTIKEVKGGFDVKLAYVGDGNNVCNSLLLGASMAGMDMSIGCPKGERPNNAIIKKAKEFSKKSGSKIEIVTEPESAVSKADIVYTDVWTSMGDEKEEERRIKFKDYQVNSRLLKGANDPLIMHCLPAKRGEEITSDVLDSSNSIVFKQAENRLHVQKALLCFLLGEL
ncbi:MAG: ornithine carbamoyltransferase [Candidatus Hydrothermarchaeaceae archaeon]